MAKEYWVSFNLSDGTKGGFMCRAKNLAEIEAELRSIYKDKFVGIADWGECNDLLKGASV